MHDDAPTLRPTARPTARAVVAGRYLLVTAAMVGVVGVAGRWLAWPLRTSTVGPTAIGIGLAALVLFGLTHYPSVSTVGMPSWNQVVASASAVGLTMAVLELLHCHHAPAAATALLVTTGLAGPGAPLIGLVVGLSIVITLGPLCGRWRPEPDGHRAAGGAPLRTQLTEDHPTR
jgi:hypothetical protein